MRPRNEIGSVALFSFVKRRSQLRGSIAVGFLPDGICIAHLHRDKGSRPRLEFCEFLSASGADAQREALCAFTRQRHLAGAPCVSVMEPGSYHLMQLEAPDVEPAELKSAVRWRIKDLIDFHIDDAVIDVFDMPGQNMRGRARMMYAVAARAALIKQRVETLTAAGLDLRAIDITELALRNITALLPEDVDGVAFLHLTRTEGTIVLTRQSTLYLARNLEVGTLTVEQGGAADGNLALAPTLERMLDTIVLEMQRSLDYFESYFSQPPLKHLVIAPPEHEVPNLLEYTRAGLTVTPRMLDLGSVVDCARPVSDELLSRCLGTIGAGLRAEEKAL